MQKIQFDYSELKRLILFRYGTVKDFAAAIGMNDFNIYERLRGKVEWGMSDMWAAVEALDIPHDEISKYFFTRKS